MKRQDWELICFAKRNQNFTYGDFKLVLKIKRLSKKHQRLSEYSCNGVGWVKGQCYYNGAIDSYSKREYGQNVKSACISEDCEETIFDIESRKIEEKINKLIEGTMFMVEFQCDPRGNTVKLFYNNDYVDLN